ncbi:membrane protease subunit HflC [Lachnospiraceae bacterium XBB2008]|nr:membrane protease subunit HflC [Lachnospiraceae bacterium XBB2008]
MKKIGKVSIILILVVAALIIFSSATYSVSTNQAAIIVRLGRIQRIEANTGLHLRTPFVEDVIKIYTGDYLYDIPTSDVITSDKKSMIADDYVIWSVTDPAKYYQTLGAVKGRAEERIEAAVYNATKNTISSMTQDAIIAARGNELTRMITNESNSDISQYGIVIKLAEIKALDLPDDNKEAVYERMISERNNIAAGYTAQGQADAQKIRNDTDRQVSIITANAQKEAAKLEAEGEAEYMRILSDAYRDEEKAEFYSYLRSLDSLDALVGSNKTLILDKDSELAHILYGQE